MMWVRAARSPSLSWSRFVSNASAYLRVNALRQGLFWRLKVYFGVATDMPPVTFRTIVMNVVVAAVILGALLLIRYVL